MPRDISGNYTLPIGNPVVSGTVIESTWANSTLSDIALQLNNVLTRDGILGPVDPFLAVDGVPALPGLAFSSAVSTGLWRDMTQAGFSFVGTPVLLFNSDGITVPAGKFLTLVEAPSDPTDGTNKAYVDALVSSAVSGYLPLTGGTMSGGIQLNVTTDAISIVSGNEASGTLLGFYNTNAGAALQTSIRHVLASSELSAVRGNLLFYASNVYRLGLINGTLQHSGTQFDLYPGAATNYEIINRNGSGFLFYINNAAAIGLKLFGDGRIAGPGLHNNAASINGVTEQFIASGTFTPTLTNTANISASTSYPAQWMRVGNVVTVSGQVDIDPTSNNTLCVLRMTAPLTNVGTAAAGCAASNDTEETGTAALVHYSSTTQVALEFTTGASPGSLDNQAWFYTYTYTLA